MTALYEHEDGRLFMAAPASLLATETFDTASWASGYISAHPGHRWILARYVEADSPNSNQQYWSLDALWDSVHTIKNSALNINHVQNEIVGVLSAAEMIYPTEGSQLNPYVETLAVFWQNRFPELYEEIEAGYSEGKLFISMECTAESLTCGGDYGCGATFPYKGPYDSSYCSHITDRTAYRSFNRPVFQGAGLIMPGTRPGWSGAWVKELAGDMDKKDKDYAIEQMSNIMPDGSAVDWENLMWSIQMDAIQSMK